MGGGPGVSGRVSEAALKATSRRQRREMCAPSWWEKRGRGERGAENEVEKQSRRKRRLGP